MKLNKASFQYMFALLFSVATLFAQNITGTVSGDDGSALAGANVAVEGTDTGASSNQDGSFSISGLSDGTYTVTASDWNTRFFDLVHKLFVFWNV